MLSLYLKCSNCKLKNKYDAEYCKHCDKRFLEESEIETSVIKQNINSKSLFIGILLILVSSFLSIVDFNNKKDELLSWGLAILSDSFLLIVYYILFNLLSNFRNSNKVLVALKYVIISLLFSAIYFSFSVDSIFKNIQLSSSQEIIRYLNEIIYFIFSLSYWIFLIVFLIRLIKFKDEFIGLFKTYSVSKLIILVIILILGIIDTYFGNNQKNYTIDLFIEIITFVPQLFLILIFIRGMIFAKSK